jgi:hypothetical protein
MPAKTVKCSICGEEVSKAKSSFIGDGKRACNSHPGVLEKKQALQAKDKERLHAEVKSFQQSDGVGKQDSERQETDKLVAAIKENARLCQCCGKKGLHEVNFHQNLVIATHMVSMEKDAPLMLTVDENKNIINNPAWVDKVRQYMLSPDAKDEHELVCIGIYECLGDNPILKRLSYQLKTAVSILGAIMLCPECANRFRFTKPQPPAFKDVKFEHMMLLGSLMKPMLDKIAKKKFEEHLGVNSN